MLNKLNEDMDDELKEAIRKHVFIFHRVPVDVAFEFLLVVVAKSQV